MTFWLGFVCGALLGLLLIPPVVWLEYLIEPIRYRYELARVRRYMREGP